MRIRPQPKNNGIAIFILLSSMVIISLAMKDLIQSSSLQAERVRNSYDRLQAIYLARSTMNLSRFFLIFDNYLDQQAGEEASDTKNDIWASPIPFPIPPELIQAMQGFDTASPLGADPEEAPPSEEVQEDLSEEAQAKQKSCGEFFDDFGGNAMGQITDLNRKLNLNDLDSGTPVVYETLLALLSPNADFLSNLEDRGINYTDVAKQIRDYLDRNDVEDISNASEDYPYTREQLEGRPKNRPFQILDELKLLPDMDDELFAYLEPFVSTVYFANRQRPAKINLNTVEKEVFQALLKDVSNPAEIALEFINDREENGRIYTQKTFQETLENEFQLDASTIQIALLGGVSDAFLVTTEAQVNETIVKMEAIIEKPTNKQQKKPVVQIRISP